MHFNALTRKNSKEGITNMKDTLEIRWHGRGGQGAKTAALLLAEVAFKTGKNAQGFPEYGPEHGSRTEHSTHQLLTTESVTTQFAYIQTFMIHSM